MIEHTPNPWKYLDFSPTVDVAWREHIAIMALNGTRVADIHPSKPSVEWQLSQNKTRGNAQLLAAGPTAPHECSDPKCPGNVNRRKLEVFDGLLAFAQRIAEDEHDKTCGIYAYDPGECTCYTVEAQSLIAKAKTTAPEPLGGTRAGSPLGGECDD